MRKSYILQGFTLLVIYLLLPSKICAESLSLNQAIDLAVSNSYAIKASRADYQAQSYRKIASWLDMGPRVSVSWTQLESENTKSPLGGSTQSGKITATQPITSLYAIAEKAHLDETQEHIKKLALDLTEAQIRFQTAEMYLRAQQSQQMLLITQSGMQAANSQKETAQAMFDSGRIHKGEYLKMSLAVSQAQTNEAKANAVKDIAFFSLKEAIGKNHDEQLELEELNPPEDLRGFDVPPLGASLKVAMEHRSELEQADKNKSVAALGKDLAYSRFAPSVNLFANRNFGDASMGSEKNAKTYGVSLTWDLWNSGSHYYQIQEATEALANVEAQAQGLQLKIRSEVMRSLANLEAAKKTFALARQTFNQAQESYRIEQLKFKSGKSSATELIWSHNESFAAEGNLVSTFAEIKIEKFKLQMALGEKLPKLEGDAL